MNNNIPRYRLLVCCSELLNRKNCFFIDKRSYYLSCDVTLHHKCYCEAICLNGAHRLLNTINHKGRMKLHFEIIQYKPYRWLYHSLFWILAVLTYTIIYGSYDDRYFDQLMINIYALPVKMAATYTMLYVFMPHLMMRGRYVWFFFCTVITAVGFAAGEWMVLYNFAFQMFHPEKYHCDYSWTYQTLIGIIHIYPIVIAAAAIKIVKLWVKDMERSQQLEREKIEAELKFLKAQINPHFLFNTLNNLYALTLKKSDQAPQVVLKLSELLDYMLYEGSNNNVTLDHEIKHIQNYIELERLRYGTRLQIETKFEGSFSGYTIAPMLLIPFIENSFKHGASCCTETPFIHLHSSITDDELLFSLKNNREPLPEKKKTEGIGLRNVQRRLELQYPGKFQLQITEKEKEFGVLLRIKLK